MINDSHSKRFYLWFDLDGSTPIQYILRSGLSPDSNDEQGMLSK